uniref:Uncharacterized protein n=1 Tax=Anguilla anguilla TaxID=7936 RepID=A0A0E9XSE9_ANGAN
MKWQELNTHMSVHFFLCSYAHS